MKYRDDFDFQSCAQYVFSANDPPRSAAASYALFRRWEAAAFTRTFKLDGAARHELDANQPIRAG